MTLAAELDQRRARLPVPASAESPLVVLVGNPNVGKTTLFNRLTGENARVGNYPGVTVERRVGRLLRDADEPLAAHGSIRAVELADVPGAYSLSARSVEEQIALNAVLGLGVSSRPDLVVVVVDAGQLIRNLYLVLQLVELRIPLIVALNMIDETCAATAAPRAAAITRLFGVPCVATDARRGRGVRELRTAIRQALRDRPCGRVDVRYPLALRRDADRIAEALPAAWRSSVERDRALALWALASIGADDELEGIQPELRERVETVRAAAGGRDLDQELIATRYAWLDRQADVLSGEQAASTRMTATERIDRLLLHPLLGFAFFVLVMLMLFQALFTWSDPAIAWIEDGFAVTAQFASRHVPPGAFRDLLTDGVIGGVGNVLVFLPQILLLFFFIGLLEDSGYMARVAFLMDRVMRALGLHGRAFVPMLSGFACAVPAILATRTMERQRDRLLTMLVVPLMTCSARLPVYTLIIGALFAPALWLGWLPVQGLLMVLMYVFSLVVTLVAAAVLGRTVLRGRRVPLILELPPYRLPNVRGVTKMMLERSTVFVREAGTVILACTIALWALLYFPRPSTVDSRTHAPSQIEQSYAGRLGKAIEPAISPLGFDWRIGVGIIGAFSAREVFVSTMGLVYGIDDRDDQQPTALRERIRTERGEKGAPRYRPLVGLSLMIFFALACQCTSTLAVVRRETKTWRWPMFLFAYMTALAYAASFAVYQVGKALGF
jgi:ferrous iron transport protein B